MEIEKGSVENFLNGFLNKSSDFSADTTQLPRGVFSTLQFS